MNHTTPLLVVQLTDTHLFADERQEMLGVQTGRSLQAVLASLQTLTPQPDLLLLTGDLSQDETVESYELLRDQITSLGIQAYWIPGNHDIPATMESILHSSSISVSKCFEKGGWNFILLNSVVPGCVHGELAPDQLVWLDAQLQEHSKPTLIALHHPPAAIGSDWMDEISLVNPSAFYEIVDRHRHVNVVLFGHIHQEFDGDRQGVRYLGTPSTCVQFKPRSREMQFDELKPGFRLLTLHSNGTYDTIVKRVSNMD